jgi:catechol 2,3-dioxygenase-like lactoylglutathione lyase family enzyme
MIKGLTFVSRVVRDLDTSLAFYHDLLGLEVVMAPTEASGPEMDAMTGIEGVKFRIVMLKGLQGATLELMQFLSPPGKESTGVDASEIGHTFIALEVNDIEQVVAELQRRGANFQMPVQEYQNGKFAYLWGPDMELVELMEYAWPPSAF